MTKKEPRESEKKEEKIVIPEPIDEAAIKIVEAEEKAEEVAAEPTAKAKWEGRGRGRRGKREEKKEDLSAWVPKTDLGRLVKEGKIKDIDEIFESGRKILEYQVVDMLIPDLQMELLMIGQAKGKFGGGKRRFWRQTQRKTAEGNVPAFACMAVVGDGKGHVGIGMGKARETLPAKSKALREAKLSLIKVARGCGSFDCSCSDLHSIPFKTEGKVGSSIMRLMPAPKGTGAVIDDECKKVMKAAGIKDVYSRTFGQTRTKINLAMACYQALKRMNEVKR
jgi:small subunit ribosomal protein S5